VCAINLFSLVGRAPSKRDVDRRGGLGWPEVSFEQQDWNENRKEKKKNDE
jgi:hypothetical protein